MGLAHTVAIAARVPDLIRQGHIQLVSSRLWLFCHCCTEMTPLSPPVTTGPGSWPGQVEPLGNGGDARPRVKYGHSSGVQLCQARGVPPIPLPPMPGPEINDSWASL